MTKTKEKSPKTMTFLQDEDAHWYLIPYEKKEEFLKMKEESSQNDDWDDFCDAFDQYRGDSPHGTPVVVLEE